MLAWMDYWTVLLVLIVALLLFGSRLPEVARSLGRSLNEFKRGLRDVAEDVDREPPAEDSDRSRRKLRPPAEEPKQITESGVPGDVPAETRSRAAEKAGQQDEPG